MASYMKVYLAFAWKRISGRKIRCSKEKKLKINIRFTTLLKVLLPLLQLPEICFESFFSSVHFLVLFQFIICSKGLPALKHIAVSFLL